MIAYKLVRKLKDGTIAPLFINKKYRFELNKWIEAEEFPTNGYAIRKGWHCLVKPFAPHLSSNNRIWIEVEVDDYQYFHRPENQGGKWILAQKIKVLRELVNINNVK